MVNLLEEDSKIFSLFANVLKSNPNSVLAQLKNDLTKDQFKEIVKNAVKIYELDRSENPFTGFTRSSL